MIRPERARTDMQAKRTKPSHASGRSRTPKPEALEAEALGRYVVADSRICGGKPTFRGTRILVADVLGQVARGMACETIVEEWRGAVSTDAIADAASRCSSRPTTSIRPTTAGRPTARWRRSSTTARCSPAAASSVSRASPAQAPIGSSASSPSSRTAGRSLSARTGCGVRRPTDGVVAALKSNQEARRVRRMGREAASREVGLGIHRDAARPCKEGK